MKDKEKLLSFGTKLRFIFSHSTLREGWDNPNVFQICTLNETRSEVKKRQEIGRGLRLCVNQNGERVRGSEVNTLTVMANESYENFALALQHEIEQEEGIRFGVIEAHTFANIPVRQMDGSTVYLGHEASGNLCAHFKDKGYIEGNGKVTDTLRTALKDNALNIPEAFAAAAGAIAAVSKKICGGLKIKNADDKRPVRLKQGILDDTGFKALWDRIKYKTTYSVDFCSQTLIKKCCESMRTDLHIESGKSIYTKAELEITAGGVSVREKKRQPVAATNETFMLPDIVSALQSGTNLTRKTIVEILVQSKTLDFFKLNPQKYMSEVLKIIGAQMRLMIVDGIKYTQIGADDFYAQELFETEELFGYLSKNMIESKKSVFEYVVYDSENEAGFAQKFESNEQVKLYCKLPGWFKIATPLGSYNPDWAVLIEEEGKGRLYFVLESKANILSEALRPTEHDKIRCGHKHFEALGSGVTFKEVDSFEKFIENAPMYAQRR